MASRRRSVHPVPLTPREALLFEAGIKLGGIFHQYLGIPVSPKTAGALARTIEAAVALQPFVEKVRVRITPARGGEPGQGRFGYRYVTGEMIDARVTLADGQARVVARLSYRDDLRYPLMRVEAASADRVQPPGRRR
jgi:dihydroneopterin aldolase